VPPGSTARDVSLYYGVAVTPGCDAIAGWLGAVGTGQDGLELCGQEIGCAATALITCLVECLQTRVRERCLPGGWEVCRVSA
jgi:hypothetical protein